MTHFTAKILSGGGQMTCVIDGKVFAIGHDHLNYNKLLNFWKNSDADGFLQFVNPIEVVEKAISSDSSGKVKLENETIYYDGQPLHNTMTDRMIKLLRSGEDISNLLNFLENLMQNPSKNSVDQAYPFLDRQSIPITPDGYFIAYKSVRYDFYDKWSGKFLNKPGEVIKCNRNLVDDNPNIHCGKGFHVGGWDYAGKGGWYNSSGDKVILVKVNPRDIVAVTTDHAFNKMRVCEYEVLQELVQDNPLNRPVYSGYGVNDDGYDATEYDHDDGWEEEDEDLETLWMDPYDVQVYDTVSFLYKGERRRVWVERIEDGLITGKLQHPEINCGKYRCFRMDEMKEVELVN